MRQIDRTEIAIAEAGITGYPGRHKLQLDALHAHARELARKIDAIMTECNYATSTMARCSLPHAIRTIIEDPTS